MKAATACDLIQDGTLLLVALVYESRCKRKRGLSKMKSWVGEMLVDEQFKGSWALPLREITVEQVGWSQYRSRRGPGQLQIPGAPFEARPDDLKPLHRD